MDPDLISPNPLHKSCFFCIKVPKDELDPASGADPLHFGTDPDPLIHNSVHGTTKEYEDEDVW